MIMSRSIQSIPLSDLLYIISTPSHSLQAVGVVKEINEWAVSDESKSNASMAQSIRSCINELQDLGKFPYANVGEVQ